MKVKLDKSIQEYLEEFDLSEREIIIYITLLKTGPNTIMNLARETGVKRSTTHNNVEELIKKGLVSQTNYGERRMVIAEDPSKLKFLMQQKKWRVEKMEGRLPTIIDEISKMVPDSKNDNSVEVKYYNDLDGVRGIYSQAISSATKEIRTFINVNDYFSVFPEVHRMFKDFLDKNKNVLIYEIVVSDNVTNELTSAIKDLGDRCKTKIVKPETTVSSFDFLITDDYVYLIEINQEAPYAVSIKSSSIAMGLNVMHRFLWEKV